MSVRQWLARALALSWLWAAPVHAEDPPARVLLVRVPEQAGGWPQAEARAAAELRAEGFEVVEVDAPAVGTGVSIEQLRRAAEAQDAVAVLDLRRVNADATGSPIALWTFDRVTGKASARMLEPGNTPPSADDTGLRAVELLRASLLELDSGIPAAEETIEAPKVVERVVQRDLSTAAAPARASLRAGPGIGWSPSGGTPDAGLLLGGAGRLHPFVWLDGQLYIAALPSTINTGTSSAWLGYGWARLHLATELRSRERVAISLGAGGGVLLTWAAGRASPGFDRRRVTTPSGFVSGRVGVPIRLRSTLRLVPAVEAGIGLPAVQVRFGDERVATFGRPLVNAGIALEWLWPR